MREKHELLQEKIAKIEQRLKLDSPQYLSLHHSGSDLDGCFSAKDLRAIADAMDEIAKLKSS